MEQDTARIIGEIERFDSVEMGWARLESLLAEVKGRAIGPTGIRALLGVFERNPSSGFVDTMMTILHLLEALPDYEPYVVESLQRRPSVFGIRMVIRML